MDTKATSATSSSNFPLVESSDLLSENRTPSSSAPARMSATDSSSTVTKAPRLLLTKEQRQEISQKYIAYTNELQKKKSAPWLSFILSLFYEPNHLENLQKVYNEDALLHDVIGESVATFEEDILKEGGDPKTALEVYHATNDIPDTRPSVLSESSDFFPLESHLSDKWELPESEKIKAIEESLSQLSSEEIDRYVTQLSSEELKNCATLLFEEKSIINSLNQEDLREQLRDCCYSLNQHAQIAISLENPKTVHLAETAFLEAPAKLENQGIRNSGVDCYLNSALQALRTSIENLPEEQQQTLLSSIRERYIGHLSEELRDTPLGKLGSPLAAFLEKKYDAHDLLPAMFLRHEIFLLMCTLAFEDEVPSAAAVEMVNSIDPLTGHSVQQCDTSEALVALMEYTGIPRVLLHETDTYADTGIIREVENQKIRQFGGESVLPFGIDHASSLQEVIAANWETTWTESPDGENLEKPGQVINKQRALANKPPSLTIALSRFRMQPDASGEWASNSKGEPIIGVPKLALDSSGDPIPEKLHTPITGITDNIILPFQEGGEPLAHATYEPSAIICHLGGHSASSGHYVTYRKENGGWELINDETVSSVNLDEPSQWGTEFDPLTHRETIERNAYVINYKNLSS